MKLKEQFNTIERSFTRMKGLTTAAVIAAAVAVTVTAGMAMKAVEESTQQVYVIDRGSAVMAARAGEDAYRDLEGEDHVRRFHELMFNVTPNAESIRRNLDRALMMSDRSAYEWYQDLAEKGFYQRLVSASISQEIVIDSVRLDMSSYPFRARTWAKLYLLRESNITMYDFESECRLVDIERSSSNPHGMMVEKFAVTRNENMGTRRR